MTRLYSWNVNGIRACQKKGLVEWILNESPDVLAIQETKAHIEQLDEALVNIDGYNSYWFSAKKKGYSGVAIYSKDKPNLVENLGVDEFDDEGRVIIVHYDTYVLINCYFPNSQAEGARLDYKLSFCNQVKSRCDDLVNQGKNVILCGDYNIAHTEIDLKNPKNNHKNPGFLPEERQWMSDFLGTGYTDIFRTLHPDEPGHYTWWSYRFQARAKDIGWRIDYFCANKVCSKKIVNATIHKDVLGSDHCPISIELDI